MKPLADIRHTDVPTTNNDCKVHTKISVWRPGIDRTELQRLRQYGGGPRPSIHWRYWILGCRRKRHAAHLRRWHLAAPGARRESCVHSSLRALLCLGAAHLPLRAASGVFPRSAGRRQSVVSCAFLSGLLVFFPALRELIVAGLMDVARALGDRSCGSPRKLGSKISARWAFVPLW